MFDCIIVGGGVSGLMAAVAASDENKHVILIEKNASLGKKLLISGGGRCNVTNRLSYEEIISNIPGNGKFLYGPFSVFDNANIISFIESNGVPLKEEDHGRMFPKSNKAKDVLNVFQKKLKENNVEVLYNTEVKSVNATNNHITGVTLNSGQMIKSKSVIIATGGKSVPKTGSTGDGHKFATSLGHSITELFPTEVPIISHAKFIQDQSLKGLSLKNVALSVLRKNGKPRVTHHMDLIFTHFGVSGPAALRCSQFIFKEQKSQKKTEILMKLDQFPNLHENEVLDKIKSNLKLHPDRAIKNALKPFAQERFITFMLNVLSIDSETNFHHLKSDDLHAIVQFLKGFTFPVHGTQSIEKAFVTGGGVDLKEITPKTMESRLVSGLYFCGEVLDIHGYTGGYNITSALVTGYVAGKNAVNK